MRSFLFPLIITAVLAGCIPQPSVPLPLTGAEADYQTASALVRDRKYPEASTLFQKIAVEAPQSAVAADAVFETAYLLVAQDNPQKDYGQAYLAFDDFLKRYPNHRKAEEAQNWKAVLKTVQESRKENDRLARSIDQLKKLDIRHEQRRGR